MPGRLDRNKARARVAARAPHVRPTFQLLYCSELIDTKLPRMGSPPRHLGGLLAARHRCLLMAHRVISRRLKIWMSFGPKRTLSHFTERIYKHSS